MGCGTDNKEGTTMPAYKDKAKGTWYASFYYEDWTGKKVKKMKYRGIFSYNPPRQKQHWINKKYSFSTVDKNTFVHTSNYLKNRYISKEFIEEAEALKERDYTAYRCTFS